MNNLLKNKYTWIVVAVILLIIFLIYRSNQAKKTAAANAAINNASNNVNALGGGQTSQVAQIINSLFPFFQTGIAATQNSKA